MSGSRTSATCACGVGAGATLAARAGVPSLEHEAPLVVLREEPELVPELLRAALGLELPMFAAVEVADADFSGLGSLRARPTGCAPWPSRSRRHPTRLPSSDCSRPCRSRGSISLTTAELRLRSAAITSAPAPRWPRFGPAQTRGGDGAL